MGPQPPQKPGLVLPLIIAALFLASSCTLVSMLVMGIEMTTESMQRGFKGWLVLWILIAAGLWLVAKATEPES